jgi:hypothetical protein
VYLRKNKFLNFKNFFKVNIRPEGENLVTLLPVSPKIRILDICDANLPTGFFLPPEKLFCIKPRFQ